MKADTKSRSRKRERIFEGLAISSGIALGPAFVRDMGDIKVPDFALDPDQIPQEVERLQRAVANAVRQVGELKTKAISLHGAAAEELGYLLDAHLQMLESTRLVGGIERRVAREGVNAEAAVSAEISAIARDFEGMEDPYLRTRAQEVQEVGNRIMRNLVDAEITGFDGLQRGSIVIAEEITPADTALMDPARIVGFASVLGGAEGHTAIMARSLGLPAVLGIADLMAGVQTGDTVIVDGSNGLVIVNPTPRRIGVYERRRQEFLREVRSLSRLKSVPATTRDGQHIALRVNLELPREIKQAKSVGAEGIGLLRTEFMFMNRQDLPDEDEQYQALKEIVEAMEGHEVTIRTLDVGGEKIASALGGRVGASPNPALGLRAIRLSLRERDLLDAQLAAILRAGAHGPVRILLPLITSPPEVREVRRMLGVVARRLKRRGVAISEPLPPLGVMIEVPGAALAADALARVSDFFALGTNDLTMYTLAIDRGDESVAHLYNPLHPAVLRLMQFSVEAALRARLPVSVCGEVAGDPRFTPLLLGLGVRELSMTSTALLRVKSRILNLDVEAATQRARLIMQQADSGRISALLDDFNEAR